MSRAFGFLWHTRKGGVVEITHHGRHATTLRGEKAADFLGEAEEMDESGQQALMARLTGNYRRGNERLAKAHPRNA